MRAVERAKGNQGKEEDDDDEVEEEEEEEEEEGKGRRGKKRGASFLFSVISSFFFGGEIRIMECFMSSTYGVVLIMTVILRNQERQSIRRKEQIRCCHPLEFLYF